MARQPNSPRSIDGINPRHSSSSATFNQRLKFSVRRKKQVLLFIICIAAVGATLVGLVFLVHANKTTVSGDDVTAVKASISQHYLLPADEEPAMATVTDKSKLNTPLLKKAENGDKLLVYKNNRLAILYRPSLGRIISVGPVTLDEPPKNLATQE
jgi:hypothetical protein